MPTSRRSLRICFTQLVAVAYLVLVAGPAVTLVFCVGADGHHAIESALDQSCCTPIGGTTDAELSHASRTCDCTDTPLILGATLQREIRGHATAPATHPAVFQRALAAPSRIVRSGSAEVASSQFAAGLAALRSIVLLI